MLALISRVEQAERGEAHQTTYPMDGLHAQEHARFSFLSNGAMRGHNIIIMHAAVFLITSVQLFYLVYLPAFRSHYYYRCCQQAKPS
jgi:hypothetical protein